MSQILAERERELVRGQLWRLAPEAQDRWASCRSSHRFMAYRGKQLVLFTFDAELKPQVVDRLSLVDARMTLEHGVTTVWQTGEGLKVDVGPLPTEVAPNTFLWTAYSSDVQYAPYKGVYSVRLPMLFQTRHNISHPTLNTTYILELAAFEAEFCE